MMSSELRRVLHSMLDEGKIDDMLKTAFGFGLDGSQIRAIAQENPNIKIEWLDIAKTQMQLVYIGKSKEGG